jgi:hypothetical protein
LNVAKLIIYRGDEFEQEVDLGEGVARIGRGADNEIVLADPMRSVSRQHAEIHFEQGSYSLIDSKSQNGLWVAGQRVKKATLAAGVPVVMGSYKLILKEEAPPVSATDATVLFRLPVDDATIVRANPFVAAPPAAKAAPPAPAPPPAVKVDAPKPPPPPAPKPAPVAETPKPPPPAPPPPPRPAPPSPPPPSPPPPSPAPSAAPPVAAKRKAGTSVPRGLVWSVLIVLLLGGLGAGVFLTPVREWLRFSGTEPAATTAAATPAAPEPAPTPVAPPPPVRRATRPPVERPLKAEVKPTPAPPPKRPTPAVVEAPPPPPPPAKETPPDLAGLFEEARSAVIKGDYLTAIAKLETILKYDANYASASNLLEVARGGAKNASQLAIDSGNKAEMSSDYAAAAKQYDRARLLDPTSSAPGDAMRRLRLRMQGEGEEVFKKAKVFDAMGRRPDAIAGYEKALELLPAEHPSAKLARESLAALKGGG